MNIFRNILFLQDYPGNLRPIDEPPRSYALGYGNHVASIQAFAPLGHAHKTGHGAVAAPVRAPRIAEAPRLLETCS